MKWFAAYLWDTAGPHYAKYEEKKYEHCLQSEAVFLCHCSTRALSLQVFKCVKSQPNPESLSLTERSTVFISCLSRWDSSVSWLIFKFHWMQLPVLSNRWRWCTLHAVFAARGWRRSGSHFFRHRPLLNYKYFHYRIISTFPLLHISGTLYLVILVSSYFEVSYFTFNMRWS